MPRKKSVVLTDHELRLMEVLWKKQRGTVADVVAALGPPPLAYSTVLTTLRTLEQKGHVAHAEDGRAFVYRPLVERGDAAKSAVRHVADRFFASSPRALALALLGDEPLSEKEISEIRKLLDARRKEKR